MKTKRIAALTALCMLLTGCGVQENQTITEERKSVCVVLKAMDSIHWMEVADGLQQAADDYDLALTVLYPEEESDVETQTDILRDAIESEPDALAIAPCDAEQEETYAKQAQEAGIQTVYIDEELETPGIPYVGSNNALIGEVAAQTLEKELGEDAQVAVIAGNEKQTTHNKRVEGFLQYIQNETEMTVLEICRVDNSSTSGGRQMMEELLNQYPQLDAVFCTSSMMVIGALQQRNAVGRDDVRLVGVDTQSDALTAVQDGDILAMISQNGYEMGYRTIEVLAELLSGGDVEDNTYVENQVIDKDNVKSFLSEYYMEGREP